MSEETEHHAETDPSGRYIRYRSILGSGSYKTVYRAFDTDEALEVAWNKLHVERLSQHDLEKVSNEVALLQRVHHKNIIKFYCSWRGKNSNGVGTIDFITEQMTSGTLKDYLKKAKAIKMKVIRRWCANILEAIAYLHAQTPPIMHRDLKCDNIFINGHVGEVKIGDLGLSGVKMREKADSVIGTPEFMAPELYEESYTEKVDIYAFGMCLLEMVSMEYPYSECTNLVQIFKKVFDNEKPRAFNRLVEGDVKNVIAACLQREALRPSAAKLLEHPLFKDWAEDSGRDSNLSLVMVPGATPETPRTVEEPNGTMEMGTEVIDWSDQLDRTFKVTMAPGEPVAGAEVSVVASKRSEAGSFTVGLEIPIGDAIKRVEFTFDPFQDKSDHIAHEMVTEFNLPASQLEVIQEEVERQVRAAKDQREAASRNATPQPAPRSIQGTRSPAPTEKVARVSQTPAPQPSAAEFRTSERFDTPVVVMNPTQTGSTSNVPPSSFTQVQVRTGLSEAATSISMQNQDVRERPGHAQSFENHGDTQSAGPTHGFHHAQGSPFPVERIDNRPLDPVSAYASSSKPSSSSHLSFLQSPAKEQAHAKEQGEILQSSVPSSTIAVENIPQHREFIPGQRETFSQPREAEMEQPKVIDSSSSMYTHSMPRNPDAAVLTHDQGFIETRAGHQIHGQISNLPAPETVGSQRELFYSTTSSHAEAMESSQLERIVPESAALMPPTPKGRETDTTSIPLHGEQGLTDSGGHVYGVQPFPRMHSVPARQNPSDLATPPTLPQSTSESQILLHHPTTETNDLPHRSSSAPHVYENINVESVTEQPQELPYSSEKESSYQTAPDVAPAPASSAVPQHLAIEEELRRGGTGSPAPTREDRQNGILQESRHLSSLPDIVVVGNRDRYSERRSNEPDDISIPPLSAKSLPELNRESVSACSSASIMGSLQSGPDSFVDSSRDRPAANGTAASVQANTPKATQVLVDPLPSNLSMRSSSWKSSHSDESGNNAIPRPPTSGVALETGLDQKWYSSCLELMEFSARGNYASVLQKLSQGASAQFADYDSRTPLHVAAGKGHLDVCTILIERGANINARDRWGRTPLTDAKSSSHQGLINLLQQHGAVEDSDVSSDLASLQLLQFAAKGDVDSIRARLVAGAVATYADYDQRTALHLACTEGHVEVAELLLVNNADPSARDSLGRTPVDDAITNGHRSVLKVLHQYGANIPSHLLGAGSESERQLGLDLVEHAAKGRVNAVMKCLRSGADVNFQDYDKRTALHLASVEGHVDIVEVLLKHGADISRTDRWGATPKDEAIKENRVAVVDELNNWERKISEKANPQTPDAKQKVANGGHDRAQSLHFSHDKNLKEHQLYPDMWNVSMGASMSMRRMNIPFLSDDFASKLPRNTNPTFTTQEPSVTVQAFPSGSHEKAESKQAPAAIEEKERELHQQYMQKLNQLREEHRRMASVVAQESYSGGDVATPVLVPSTLSSRTQSQSPSSEVLVRSDSEIIGSSHSQVPAAAAEASVDSFPTELPERTDSVLQAVDEDDAADFSGQLVHGIIDSALQEADDNLSNEV